MTRSGEVSREERGRTGARQRKREARGGQMSLRFRTWGGARPGAGRPRTSKHIAHTKRERVSRHVPLHVTLRLVGGLPSLREKRTFRVVREVLGEPRAGGAAIVQYSVQSNHVHLIVEAPDKRGLARGVQALSIRLAKRLNRLFARSGAVFADRFHARSLKTPLEVRRALAYVLNNYRKHAEARGPRLPLAFVDPCSSALWFDGWDPEWTYAPPDPRATRDPCPSLSRGVVAARAFLLRRAWRRHGLVRPFDVKC
jgi:putative transposase